MCAAMRVGLGQPRHRATLLLHGLRPSLPRPRIRTEFPHPTCAAQTQRSSVDHAGDTAPSHGLHVELQRAPTRRAAAPQHGARQRMLAAGLQRRCLREHASRDTPSAGASSTSPARPSVSVPVLSNATVRTRVRELQRLRRP